jgi:hypothetical protein
MIVKQLSIFAENKPGSLARVTAILSKTKINIRATTISTSDTFGVIGLIVDNPEHACKALSDEGVMVTLKDVIAVLIGDKPGGLDRLVQLLYKENVNIVNAYGFVLESAKTAVFIIDADPIDWAERLIEQGGFKMLSSQELSAV